MIPKVGVPADVYIVECIVSQIEEAKGYKNKIGTEALIETPLGMANVEAIASAPSRLEAHAFRRRRLLGLQQGAHRRHRRSQPGLSRRSVALPAVAHDRRLPRFGLRPIDGPFGGIDDPEGYKAARSPRSSARHGRQMGYPSLADRTLPTTSSRRRRKKSSAPNASS